jgi:MFS family permease
MSIYTDGSFELKASDSKLPALKIGPVITLGIPAGLMTLAVLVIVFAQVRTELEMSGTVAIIALAAASTTHAAVIMPAAALGDRFGRRKLFAIALLTGLVGGVVCASAQDPTMFIIGRLVTGI